jgi:osmoprotectant transport system ATP-binding protein
MISVRNVSKNFKDTEAVRGVSFEVPTGKTLVLLGTSGSGKTTTLKMINRLMETSSGEIFINGMNISSTPPELLRRKIGYISQNNGLFPHYTVAENLAIVPKLLKWDQVTILAKSKDLLERIRLPFEVFANKYPHQLSGGQQQRVAIARAMVTDPPLLLMDEPFGALDPITKLGIRKEFKDLTRSDRKTIVVVTHDILEAIELGDQICLMDNGEIIQSGTAQTLIFTPKNKFVKDFFGNQRLQLELTALTLGDIWEHLSDRPGLAAPHLQRSQTLWEAMELLSACQHETMVVGNESQRTFKEISLVSLNAAYLLFKRNARAL